MDENKKNSFIEAVMNQLKNDHKKYGEDMYKDGIDRSPEEALKELKEKNGGDILSVIESFSKQLNGYSGNEASEKNIPENSYELDEIIKRIDGEMPPKPMIRLIPKPDKTGITDSKFGGIPYLPKGFPYPMRRGKNEDIPLKLLVQLNFGELPHIEGFPEKGILQIFCAADDDYCIGMDFENGIVQNGFRVLYHENFEPDSFVSPEDMPKIDFDDGMFPFKGEYSLKSEIAESIPTADDIFFYRKLFKYCAEVCGADGKNFKTFKEIEDAGFKDVYNKTITERRSVCCCIGGYPAFEQDDPRFSDGMDKFDTLLFQMPSIFFTKDRRAIGEGEHIPYKETDRENEIMWGDMGIANFFISSENLKNRDFSEILYNWSCG